MKVIKGNLLDLASEGKFNVIAHGCNCFHTFGAGIAKGIKQMFPEAYEADRETKHGDVRKMGNLSFYEHDTPVRVYNLYTQVYPGKSRGIKFDTQRDRYNAIESALKRMCKHLKPTDKLGLPMIGAGLAGGDWGVISEIIIDVLPFATIVQLPTHRNSFKIK